MTTEWTMIVPHKTPENASEILLNLDQRNRVVDQYLSYAIVSHFGMLQEQYAVTDSLSNGARRTTLANLAGDMAVNLHFLNALGIVDENEIRRIAFDPNLETSLVARLKRNGRTNTYIEQQLGTVMAPLTGVNMLSTVLPEKVPLNQINFRISLTPETLLDEVHLHIPLGHVQNREGLSYREVVATLVAVSPMSKEGMEALGVYRIPLSGRLKDLTALPAWSAISKVVKSVSDLVSLTTRAKHQAKLTQSQLLEGEKADVRAALLVIPQTVRNFGHIQYTNPWGRVFNTEWMDRFSDVLQASGVFFKSKLANIFDGDKKSAVKLANSRPKPTFGEWRTLINLTKLDWVQMEELAVRQVLQHIPGYRDDVEACNTACDFIRSLKV